jgi:hypothetical protein
VPGREESVGVKDARVKRGRGVANGLSQERASRARVARGDAVPTPFGEKV